MVGSVLWKVPLLRVIVIFLPCPSLFPPFLILPFPPPFSPPLPYNQLSQHSQNPLPITNSPSRKECSYLNPHPITCFALMACLDKSTVLRRGLGKREV